MGALGIEVLQKLRSAVKAKVIELKSGYVGEELPEYIMILIVNKKTSYEMETALQIFLGNRTGPFVEWLQDVLAKLEEVTLPKNNDKTDLTTSITDIIKTGLIEQVKRELKVGTIVKTETIEIDDNDDEVEIISDEITRKQIEELQTKIDKAKKKLLDDAAQNRRSKRFGKNEKQKKIIKDKDALTKNTSKNIAKRKVRIKKEPSCKESKSKTVKISKDKKETTGKSTTIIKLSEVLRAEQEAIHSGLNLKQTCVETDLEKRRSKVMKRETEKIKAHIMDVKRRFKPANRYPPRISPFRRSSPRRHHSPKHRDNDLPHRRRSYSPRRRSLTPSQRYHRDSSRLKRHRSRSPYNHNNRGHSSHYSQRRHKSRSPKNLQRNRSRSPRRIHDQRQKSSLRSKTSLSQSPLLKISSVLTPKKSSVSPSHTSIGSRLIALSQTPQTEKTNSSQLNETPPLVGNKDADSTYKQRAKRDSKHVKSSKRNAQPKEIEQVNHDKYRKHQYTDRGKRNYSKTPTLSSRKRPVMRARMDEEEKTQRRRLEEDRERKKLEDKARKKLNSQVIVTGKNTNTMSLAFIEKLIEEEERQNEREQKEKEMMIKERDKLIAMPVSVQKFDTSRLKEKIIVEVPNDLMTDVIDIDFDDEIIALDEDESFSNITTPASRNEPSPETMVSTADSTQFIVTISGKAEKKRENPKFVQNKPTAKPELPYQSESNETKTKSVIDSSPLSNEAKTSSTFQRRKISPITFDLTDTEMTDEEDHSKRKRTKASKKIEPITITAKTEELTDKTNIASRLGVVSKPEPLILFKSKERCKFFPNCSNTPCDFHHPSIPCAIFPHCIFGADHCNFLHPQCKYDSLCTKSDCNFLHTKSISLVPKVLPRPVVTTSLVVCKFHPSCMNPVCPYYHPKPCKYGKFCVNKKDCAFYHDDIPAKDSLTWIAT